MGIFLKIFLRVASWPPFFSSATVSGGLLVERPGYQSVSPKLNGFTGRMEGPIMNVFGYLIGLNFSEQRLRLSVY
jgi:hypothetical protein